MEATYADDARPAGAVVPAAIIGNALEWFDFTVYGLFSSIIARNFFPSADPAAALLLTLATFGVGFVLRPVGAVVLGHYADRAGRRAALSLIILLMSLGTAMIAFCPTYRTIGLGAPVIMVLARLVQGFSVGGEFGGATAFLIESAPPDRKGLYGSWQFAGQAGAALAGSLVAVAVTRLLTPAQVEDWGWRLPFLLGLMIAPVGLYLRLRLSDSADFDRAVLPERPPILVLLKDYLPGVLAGFALTILGTAAIYLVVFHMPTYAARELRIPLSDGFLSGTIAGVLFLVLNPIAGRLSDGPLDRRQILAVAALGLGLLSYPLFKMLVLAPGLPVLIVVQGALTAMIALFTGPSAAAIGALFPAEVRSTGLSLGYNLAVPIFGGFAPFFVTALETGDHMAPAWYIAACAVPSVVALVWWPAKSEPGG